MPVHQYEASLYATPPSGGVRFVFCAIPTGFVRVAHSTPWLLYAASPCGEALELGSPASLRAKHLNLTAAFFTLPGHVLLCLSCRPPFDTNKLFLLVFCPDERKCFIA